MGAAKPVRTWTYDGVVPGYTWELWGGDVLAGRPAQPPAEAATPASHDDGPPASSGRPRTSTRTDCTSRRAGSPTTSFWRSRRAIASATRSRSPTITPPACSGTTRTSTAASASRCAGGMAGIIVDPRRPRPRPGDQGRPASRSWSSSRSSSAPTTSCWTRSLTRRRTQAFFPRKNVLYTVNGKLKPTVTMYPGEVQRWRLLNAAEGKFMSLKLQEPRSAPDRVGRTDAAGTRGNRRRAALLRQSRRAARQGRKARDLRSRAHPRLEPEAEHPGHARVDPAV